MKPSAKTIQIFLPGGDPQGIRIAEVTTRIVQVIEVPRSLLQDFIKMPECDQVALYFLFGESEDGSQQKVYIGQTGSLRERLTDHNKKKDFWQRALVLISRTHSLTQTHALFLEWYCIQATRTAGRYADENSNSGSKPHTPAPLEADCLEVFETGRTLLATLGYPIFDPVVKTEQTASDEVFFCTGSGANGRGIYTQEGFVVFKDSRARIENVPSVKGTAMETFRKKLFDSSVLSIDGETAVMTKDHLFQSPSYAAFALLGRNANGWTEWKTKDGKTLDAVKRQSVSATSTS
jgi:hypothetical protein